MESSFDYIYFFHAMQAKYWSRRHWPTGHHQTRRHAHLVAFSRNTALAACRACYISRLAENEMIMMTASRSSAHLISLDRRATIAMLIFAVFVYVSAEEQMPSALY